MICIFGKPMPHRKSVGKQESKTLSNARNSGVALASLESAGEDPRRLKLWNSRRRLAAIVPYGSGRRVVHLFVFLDFLGPTVIILIVVALKICPLMFLLKP